MRSHLRMTGRWTVRPRGERRSGKPWLVLRGERAEAVLWNGPVLELHTRALGRLGPDILERPPRLDDDARAAARADGTRWFGETLLDQSLVAGIGNMWLAEALWEARLSPWRRLARRSARTSGGARSRSAAELMRASVDRGRGGPHQVYRRVGRPCPRCRTRDPVVGAGRRQPHGVLVPGCQVGESPRGA